MLVPKRTKYRKYQKGRSRGIQSNNFKTNCAPYKIVSLSSARLKASTIEAVRRVITRKLKRLAQVLVKVHPSICVTEKPLEVRMGKGKGGVSYWICRIKKGQVLYEIDGFAGGNDASKVESAWQLADAKLPIKTKIYY